MLDWVVDKVTAVLHTLSGEHKGLDVRLGSR